MRWKFGTNDIVYGSPAISEVSCHPMGDPVCDPNDDPDRNPNGDPDGAGASTDNRHGLRATMG